MTTCFWQSALVDMPLEQLSMVCQGVKSWLLMLLVLTAFFATHPDPVNASNGEGVPCLYEGQLNTDKNWHGYLANISIMTTGSMMFEFSYPADKCCQNILFYSEDQMSIISARMNCWQKEYLLRPEDDQILRLTPRFVWSGCRMAHPNAIATYICNGGRSFTSTTTDNRPTTWYVAVSNCAALGGLDLNYKLQVFGHTGDCPHLLTTTQPTTTMTTTTSKETLVPKTSSATQVSDQQNVCVVEGTVNVTNKWYGFVSNMSLATGGGFRFTFTYPYDMQIQNVILYNEENVKKLHHRQDCWQKDGIIRTRNVPDQILDLSYRSSWNGCVSKNTSAGRMLTCRGERRYEEPRDVYMAICNCRGLNGLYLDYRLEVSGFTGDMCHSGSAPSVLSGRTLPLGGLATISWSLVLSVVVSCWFFLNSSVMCQFEDSRGGHGNHGERMYHLHSDSSSAAALSTMKVTQIYDHR